MDIATLFNLYGKPSPGKCPDCEGKGCKFCREFGYIARTNNPNIIYTYSYPMFLDLKKRDSNELIRNVITAILSLCFIFGLIISYIINITHG